MGIVSLSLYPSAHNIPSLPHSGFPSTMLFLSSCVELFHTQDSTMWITCFSQTCSRTQIIKMRYSTIEPGHSRKTKSNLAHRYFSPLNSCDHHDPIHILFPIVAKSQAWIFVQYLPSVALST